MYEHSSTVQPQPWMVAQSRSEQHPCAPIQSVSPEHDNFTKKQPVPLTTLDLPTSGRAGVQMALSAHHRLSLPPDGQLLFRAATWLGLAQACPPDSHGIGPAYRTTGRLRLCMDQSAPRIGSLAAKEVQRWPRMQLTHTPLLFRGSGGKIKTLSCHILRSFYLLVSCI